jgi:hypothetical protein
MVILAAGLPVLTAWVALQLKSGSRLAFLSGLLAAFAGFYLPFLVTTDAFATHAWIATLALLAGAAAFRTDRGYLWFASGLAAGAAQLARADGLLLLIPLAALAILAPRRRAAALALLAAGVALALGPWMARTLAVSGSLLSPGGTRTLWLARYDELFAYPSTALGPERWWSQGIGPILSARFAALGTNLRTLVVVVGGIVLGPFMLVGAWQKRREPIVAASGGYLLLLVVAMTLAFPFSGARGGLFHSSSGILPVAWALAPVGMEAALGWLAQRRKWDPSRASRMFVPAILAFVILISGWVAWDRVIAGWPAAPRWEISASQHRAVAEALARIDPSPGVVAVNDPPGFYLASGLPCVVVPHGDTAALQALADRADVDWVILDANRPEPLAGLYQAPGSVPWLSLEATLMDAQGRPIYLLRVAASEAGAS